MIINTFDLTVTDKGLNEKTRRRRVIKMILKHFSVDKLRDRESQPFEILVRTILSQNTSDVNSIRALEILRTKVGVTPDSLSQAGIMEIKDAIRSAGLYNSKAPRIKKLAQFVRKTFGDHFDRILERSDQEIRDVLTDIHGIGLKTADVFLAFAGDRDIIPVDTHVDRISKRLGFVERCASYEEVRKSLEEASPGGKKANVHLSMIRLGREICVARRPRCEICPLSDPCPSIGVRST